MLTQTHPVSIPFNTNIYISHTYSLFIFTSKRIRCIYCITGKLNYLQENVNMGVVCSCNLVCLCHRMHTEKCDKHLFISYLLNIQTTARCIINITIKVSDILCFGCLNSAAN